MVGLVPFLISCLDRKCLLLGVHVQQQVSNAVAVAKLVVIPGETKSRMSRLLWIDPTLFSLYINALLHTRAW